MKKPTITSKEHFKKHLKKSLLEEHQRQSSVPTFIQITKSFVENMSLVQKRAIITAALAGVVVITAGVFGPSAASVANAEAKNTINRAFVRIANLSDQERADLEQRFQGRIDFQKGRMKELTPEEKEAMKQKMKLSFETALKEAQAAPDLKKISADEMPMPGFIGKAGRGLGFKMMYKPDGLDKLPELSADVKFHIENEGEVPAIPPEMKPVSFLVYTNSKGQTVHLGLNAKDEPVALFIQFKEGDVPFGKVSGEMQASAGKVIFFQNKIGE